MNSAAICAVLLLLVGCGQNASKGSEFSNGLNLREVHKAQHETKNKPPAPNEKWFDPDQLDTTIVFSNGLKVTLYPSEVLDIEPYFIDQPILDSISAKHTNSHLMALAIEKHLLPGRQGFVIRDSSGLWLLLFNGQWKLLSPKPNTEETDHTFEHHFVEHGYYSIFTQWTEGGGFKLFSRATGIATPIYGRPYFSPSGEYVLSVSADIEAGYSANGFQLFRNCYGELKLLATYKSDIWGPYSAKWLNDSQFVMKNMALGFEKGQTEYLDFCTQVDIDEFWE